MTKTEWKGICWKGAFSEFSVRELLTVLKGFGPLEVLEFEMPEYSRGQLSISLTRDKRKEVTLYHLETLGPQRQGKGRASLLMLKELFKGGIFVEDPGILMRSTAARSLLFWLQMFREGNVRAVEGDDLSLHCGMSAVELEAIEKRLRNGTAVPGRGAH
ncbi:MAG: hypothetical protein ABFD98_07400 [Syntrophobacteraceae bacterium]|nr:hypothetical protein [Desulfobacteraceae bacterium]